MSAPFGLHVDHGNPANERAVCAALCWVGPEEAAIKIADLAITADLFVCQPTRDLFALIETQARKGVQVDRPLFESLYKKGVVEGNTVQIEWETSLDENKSAANLHNYVKILKDHRKDREQKRLTARLVEAANAGDLEAVDAYKAKIEALQRSDKPTRDHHFQWAKEFCQQPPESNYLISVIADLDSTGCIVGDSQAGKSFVAIDRACHIANGMNWLGRKTKAGIVLYIIGEGASGTRKRIKAWHDNHGLEISDRLAIRTVPAALCNPASVKELIESVKAFLADLGEMPVLIELDTLNRNFGPGDENQTKDMTAFVAGMDALRRATGAHVSTVHHFGKGDKNSPRGSIVLESNLDFSYHVKKTGDPQQPETLLTTMKFEKVKDRQPPAPVAWRWHIQDLPWLDENGDRQTSVVLLQAPAQDPHTPAQDRTKPHTPAKQRIALEALRSALVGHGIDVDEAPGVASVAEEEWRQAAYSAGISSAEASQNAKRMAFNRARDELVASKKVDCQNDRYWIPHTRTQPHKTAQSAAVCGPDMNAQTAQDRTTPLRGVQFVRVCGIPDPTPDPATGIEENENVPTPDPTPASQTQTQTLDEVDRALVNAATAKPQTRRDLGRIAGYSKLPDLDKRINKLRLAGLLAMQSGKVVKGTVLLL